MLVGGRYAGKGSMEKMTCELRVEKWFYRNMERCVDVSSVALLGRNVFLLLTQQQSDTSFSVLTAHQLR